jgi:hypothetical protein
MEEITYEQQNHYANIRKRPVEIRRKMQIQESYLLYLIPEEAVPLSRNTIKTQNEFI